MRIMVVEDDIHVASLLAAALTNQGHKVISAHDAEEALALLAQHRPDALLLDVLLGELSGIDLLRQLRRTDQDLPVVLLTGQATANVSGAARRLGVTDILEKPFGLKRLPQALREALAGRATRPRRARAQGRPSAVGPVTGRTSSRPAPPSRVTDPAHPTRRMSAGSASYRRAGVTSSRRRK